MNEWTWFLGDPERLPVAGGEYIVLPPYFYWLSAPARTIKQLFVYSKPTMCKAQGKLALRQIFLSYLCPISSFLSHTQKASKLLLSICFCGKAGTESRKVEISGNTQGCHIYIWGSALPIHIFWTSYFYVPSQQPALQCLAYIICSMGTCQLILYKHIDSINTLWKMRRLGTKRVRVLFQKIHSSGIRLKVQMLLHPDLQYL